MRRYGFCFTIHTSHFVLSFFSFTISFQALGIVPTEPVSHVAVKVLRQGATQKDFDDFFGEFK